MLTNSEGMRPYIFLPIDLGKPSGFLPHPDGDWLFNRPITSAIQNFGGITRSICI